MAMPWYHSMPESSIIEHRLLDEHAWLLIDQAHASESPWGELPGASIAPAKLADRTHELPRLVSLRSLDQKRRDALLPDLLGTPPEATRAVAALLASPASETRVLNHLRQRLVVTIPRQGEHLFRYYDPRVFRHLLWMSTPLQLAALFGPIETWTWRDGQSRWRRDHPPREAPPAPAFLVSDLDLTRIGMLESCLRTLCRTVPGLEDDTDNTLAQRANALLDKAMAHGLTDEADLFLYADQAMRHPGVHRHPELLRRLQAATDEDSYVGACSDIDTETLGRYAAELNRPRKEPA
jgi:hypothetical protein